MEIKTCEQYVLAQLFDQQDENNMLNRELKYRDERIGKLTGLIDRATTHLVLDEDGRTCCAKCGCDYLCMSSATYCPDCGAKVAKNG